VASLLLQILPVAFVITINPVPIIAALILSTTHEPLASGLAYIGALLGVMALFGALVLLVFGGSLVTGAGKSSAVVHWAWLAIGSAFLAAFVVVLVRRRHRDDADKEPRWMHLIGRTGPAGAAAVGVLLVNYEMQTPAMVDILGADVTRAQAFVALSAFIAVACALPVLIVAGALIARDRVAIGADRAKAWLARYNRPVLLVLFAAIGAVYTTKGLIALVH
jgi:membrane protein implicated in regulation of membrane protease activity